MRYILSWGLAGDLNDFSSSSHFLFNEVGLEISFGGVDFSLSLDFSDFFMLVLLREGFGFDILWWGVPFLMELAERFRIKVHFLCLGGSIDGLVMLARWWTVRSGTVFARVGADYSEKWRSLLLTSRKSEARCRAYSSDDIGCRITSSSLMKTKRWYLVMLKPLSVCKEDAFLTFSSLKME